MLLDKWRHPISRFAAYMLMCGVVFASFLPSKDINEMHLFGSDKLHHCLAYGAITFMFFWSRRESPIRRSWIFGFLLWVLSGLIELLQPIFAPGRQADAYDWVANGTGILMAGLLFCVWRFCLMRR